jgi:hypothetical protein
MKRKREVKGTGTEKDQSSFQGPPLQKQVLSEKAEEYLKESGNIEDMPSPEEVEEAENTERKENQKK